MDSETRMAMPSPIGELVLVVREGSLVEIRLPGENTVTHNGSPLREAPPTRDDPSGHVAPPTRPPVLEEVRRQLREYFAGRRVAFHLPLDAAGTAWQTAVWSAMSAIPYGETVTYGEIARGLGRPSAARAVGHAAGQNPLPIVVPCHRVIGADGGLRGYGGGLDAKQRLLALERARVSS